MALRVGILLYSLSGGGIPRSMLNLASGLISSGYQVDVIVPVARGHYSDQVPDEAFVVELGTAAFLPGLWALQRYLRLRQPTAVVSAIPYLNLRLLLARKLSGVQCRVLLTERTMLSNDRYEKSIRNRILPWLQRRFYPHAQAIVAVSKGTADDLARFSGIPRHKIIVVHNPVVTDRLYALADAAPPSSDRMPDKSFPLIVAVGRLTAAKDFHVLISAFAKVRTARPSRLVILGEGPERAALEQLVKDFGLDTDVRLPGFSQNPYAVLRRADVFVQTSRWEGFGNALVEAMACGCPVVSTDCPSGPREILEDGKFGRLVPVGDVDQIALAILETLNEPKNVKRSESRARDFHVDVITPQYRRLIDPDWNG